MKENFYANQRQKLMQAFDKTRDWYKPHFREAFGNAFADQVLQEARSEYELLIPRIPFVGGPKVHMTEDLMEAVRILAYLRVLRARGKTLEECKEILYRSMETRLAKYPRPVLKLGEIRAFSKPFTRYLQCQAKESQGRKYPRGFVFDYVAGDGKEFDWGLNIFECGIRRFYLEQNASEFLKMVCSIDYLLSDKLGYGLYRTETLVEGAERCNPRLKRGGRTQWR